MLIHLAVLSEVGMIIFMCSEIFATSKSSSSDSGLSLREHILVERVNGSWRTMC